MHGEYVTGRNTEACDSPSTVMQLASDRLNHDRGYCTVAGTRAQSLKAQRAQLRCSSSLGDFNSYQQRWNEEQQGSNDPIDQEWEVSLVLSACLHHACSTTLSA